MSVKKNYQKNNTASNLYLYGTKFIYCFCIQPCFEVLLILPFRIASLYRLTWYKSRNVSWRWPSRRCGTGSIRIVPATTVKSWRQSSAKTRLNYSLRLIFHHKDWTFFQPIFLYCDMWLIPLLSIYIYFFEKCMYSVL